MYNLGWKLAAILNGADAALFDTYNEERRPVAQSVMPASSKIVREHLSCTSHVVL
ncbi:FAD-dependent monooxygenase [Paenibacillus xylanexedens]|uniref:FAD-dependent monooxygenase n=1 Tax=Paenibacillus xylanexedens TaxID=528191 RepID=UPI001F0BB583|nr:FAD-dependent monooxygenase [Paenibacillus xylanexedens]